MAPQGDDLDETPDPRCEKKEKPEIAVPESHRKLSARQESPQLTGHQQQLQAARDIGWLITVLAASSALLGSWTLFLNDAVGNAAGTWVSGCATVAILGAMWLRSSSTRLGVAITALPGGVLLLLGALRDYPTEVTTIMVGGGAGIVLGALMQAGNGPQGTEPR